MKPVAAVPLSLCVDTIETLGRDDFCELESRGMTARGGYIERLTTDEIATQLDLGIPLLPIAYAKEYDADAILRMLEALKIPAGCDVVLDTEAITDPPDLLIANLNRATSKLFAAGYRVLGYFGAGQPLTSRELTNLLLDRYWKGCSRIVDRVGDVAEPLRGWTMIQGRPPNVIYGGKNYDVSLITRDYRDDLPMFVGP